MWEIQVQFEIQKYENAKVSVDTNFHFFVHVIYQFSVQF
jgi:imidazoleglycerol phosphate dehydratase HisB